MNRHPNDAKPLGGGERAKLKSVKNFPAETCHRPEVGPIIEKDRKVAALQPVGRRPIVSPGPLLPDEGPS